MVVPVSPTRLASPVGLPMKPYFPAEVYIVRGDYGQYTVIYFQCQKDIYCHHVDIYSRAGINTADAPRLCEPRLTHCTASVHHLFRTVETVKTFPQRRCLPKAMKRTTEKRLSLNIPRLNQTGLASQCTLLLKRLCMGRHELLSPQHTPWLLCSPSMSYVL